VSFESFHGKVLFHTSFNEYFKENLKLFDAADFIALLTQHLPPKGAQYLRRYGLYSSRSRGKWADKPHVAALAPEGLGVATAHRPDATRSILILRIHTKAKTYTTLMLLSAQRSAGPHGHG